MGRRLLVILALLFLSAISIGSQHKIVKSTWIEGSKHIYLVYSETGHGTGFAVKTKDGKTFIVTNRHVCGFKGEPMMMRDSEGREYPVVKRWISKKTDLCAIEAPSTAVPLEIADSLKVGDHFITIGYPLVRFMSKHEGHVIGDRDLEQNWIAHYIPQELSEEQCSEVGLVQSYEENGSKQMYCRILILNTAVTDMFIGAGASGSPIINDDGKVIGVLFGGKSVGGPIVLGAFIRLELLVDFLKSIK